MEIIINQVESTTIENFADHYGLVMEVNERTNPKQPCWRWYASFKHCEVKSGGGLTSNFGDGTTPEEAIKHYARNISLKNIVINAYKKDKRREITVPMLTEG